MSPPAALDTPERVRLDDHALLDVLARAASPAERLAGGWLRVVDEPTPLATRRLERWIDRVADGDRIRATAILAERGLSVESWRLAQAHVTAVPGQPQPEWARDARRLLELVGTEAVPIAAPRLRDVAGDGLPAWVDGEQPWRFHAGFADWLTEAGRRVGDWCAGAPIAATARRDLVLDLARRLLGVSGPLLMAVSAARRGDDPLFGTDPRADWELLWLSHPVVARLLAVGWRQWRRTTAELCARIAADLTDLCPGATVHRIESSGGDQHDGGRSVARLRLSDGSSVFLKPRADGLHRVLQGVLDRVEGAGPRPFGLRLPEISERAGYTWVREVGRADCPDDDAVAGYFRRAGALLRVVQALGATDLHHENFVPTADQPVLVDLETVVAPGALRPAEGDPDPIATRLADTPGPTSMVTTVVAGPPGRSAADLGALAGPAQTLTPYAVRTLTAGADGPELRQTRVPLGNGTALPTRAARPVPVRGHRSALLDGYAEAQRRLARLAGLAAQPGPELRGPGAEPVVRVVVRPTRTYARLLATSTSPGALVDGVDREHVLETLYRATGTAPVALIAAEVESLRDLDVPLFSAAFDSTDLIGGPTRVLPDVLTESAADRTRRRLAGVRDDPGHLEDLQATLFAMDPVGDRPIGARPAVVDPVQTLLDRSIALSDGSLGWIGLEHDANRNRWHHGRLGPGLSGQAGVGLALAAAGQRAAAHAALLGCQARMGTGAGGPTDAFGGPAGLLYATAAAARLLDDPALLELAYGLLAPSLRAARRDEPAITVDGTAGAILALRLLPETAAVTEARAELSSLLARSRPGETDPPDRWAATLASRADGRAWAADSTAARPYRKPAPAPVLDPVMPCVFHGLAAAVVLGRAFPAPRTLS
jgi:hypothetical protein